FDSLKRMKENGLVVESVEAWHNFYPRPETGLGLSQFIEQNKKLKAEGITVMAFIPGDESLRGPLFMKLPTLEKHRHESPFFDFLKRMKENGLVVESVEAWHNFYPRPETGLGLSQFIEQNKKLKAEGITVMAFIPGDESLRGPLFMKLPTLEKHRHESPFSAFLEMRHDAFVDKILIGDHSIRSESLAQFKDYKQAIITLRAIPSQHISQSVDKLDGIHT